MEAQNQHPYDLGPLGTHWYQYARVTGQIYYVKLATNVAQNRIPSGMEDAQGVS